MATSYLGEGDLLQDRYEILEVVGRGGMGTVYRAKDRRLDKVVAVKEMIDRKASEEEQEAAIKQFEREAKLLASLSHPNLPRVTDYFVQEDRWYLIMEFVEGKTLEVALRDAGAKPMPVKQVLTWGMQLADVLAYLHSQKPPVVFRDLKPANIMLQSDGLVRLIDFGIARRFQSGATKDTLLYGSPGYSPPEQYGRAQTDARSDLYALGATLHHLSTGKDPSPTPFKFSSPSQLNPEVPLALDKLIMQCVEMDIDKRIPSAEMARDLMQRLKEAESASDLLRERQKSQPAGGKASAPISARVNSGAMRPVGSPARALGIAGLVVAIIVVGVFVLNRPPAPTKTPKTLTGGTNPGPINSGGAAATGATLKVTSTPSNSAVLLDGQPVGSTPLTLEKVSPGSHSIEIQAPPGTNLQTETRQVDLKPSETFTLDLALKPSASTGSDPGIAGGETPAVEFGNTSARAGLLPAGGPNLPIRKGILITCSARITGPTAATGTLTAFIYQADGAPAPTPSQDAAFRTPDGQMSASLPFTISNGAVDLKSAEIYLPEEVVGRPYGGLKFRVVAYVNNRPVHQTDLLPVNP